MKIVFRLSPLVLSPFLLLSCKEHVYVDARGGLNARATPSEFAPVRELIQRGAELKPIEEQGPIISLNGRSGKWTRVRYRDQEFWVFGGLLSREHPAIDVEDLTFQVTQRAAATEGTWTASHHKYSAKPALGDLYTVSWNQADAANKYRALGPDVRVVNSGDEQYLEIGTEVGYSDPTHVQIWRKSSSWEFVQDAGPRAWLLFLNDDQEPDLITLSGCCGSQSVDVYLGQDHGPYKSVFSWNNNSPKGCKPGDQGCERGPDTTTIVSIGRCGKTQFKINHNNRETEKTIETENIRFDCDKNNMLPAKAVRLTP